MDDHPLSKTVVYKLVLTTSRLLKQIYQLHHSGQCFCYTEISDKLPEKIFIFIIYKNIFWIQVSKKNITYNFENRRTDSGYSLFLFCRQKEYVRDQSIPQRSLYNFKNTISAHHSMDELVLANKIFSGGFG